SFLDSGMILETQPTPIRGTFGPGVQMWRVQAVLIQGPSMAPTLRHGDAVLVLRGGRGTRPGGVVVARFHSRPHLLVLKRGGRRAGWGGAGGQPGRSRRFPRIRVGRRGGAGLPAFLAPPRTAVTRAYSRPVPDQDPVFELHRGGKMAVLSTVALSTREDLAM